jgi:peptidoglycan biosynthesis protein MviN/MurJ (putative lipid II flippase)
MGLGKPRTPAIASVAAGLLNLALSVLLIRPFGLVGVAVGTAIPNVLFAACMLVVACRALELTVADYVKYVVPRAALGAVPTVVLLLSLKLGLHIQTLAGLVVSGSVMMLCFGITWIFFVYRQDPYVDLRPHLGRLRAWNKA